jgi:hypothetical protein
MKLLRTIMAALFSGTAVAAENPKPAPNKEEAKQTPKPSADAMRELRLRALSDGPERFHFKKKTAEGEEVYAVLMDWPLDEAVVTIVAIWDGEASIYTTGTFGIIGGVGHESVRKAATALTDEAQKNLALAAATTDFAYAKKGQVRFFFLTFSGVRSVIFTEAEVEKKGTTAFTLYSKAQQVLTEMRMITQQQRGY